MNIFSFRLTTLFLTGTIGLATVGAGLSQTNYRHASPVKTNSNLKNKAVKPNQKKTLEMVFVIDTTGSMGGLIEGAKQKVWSIVNDVMQRKDRPNVKIGLVAYRDNGDVYVTKVTALTDDLDKIYSNLMDYQADGGGDTPENVRRALADGVSKVGWSKSDRNTAQILFLVGDAPPHDDYNQEPDVLVTTAKAVKANMIINTIQCGNLEGTREIWQTIAQRGEGKYFAIAQDGGVQAIATPYDTRLAELAQKTARTYMTYGSPARQRANISEISSNETKVATGASLGAQADRAVNKAVNARAYKEDLIQDIENETIKLEDVKDADLPENLKKMSVSERKKEVEKRLTERKAIRLEIIELSKKRDEFIKAEQAKSGKQDGFDSAVSKALSEQMLKKGIK